MYTEIVNRLADRAIAAMPLRCTYGIAVLQGAQNWSGSDLQGKARRYGASYMHARQVALTRLLSVGGMVLTVENNKMLTAVPVCVDDYGNEVYATRRGFAWPNTRKQYQVQE